MFDFWNIPRDGAQELLLPCSVFRRLLTAVLEDSVGPNIETVHCSAKHMLSC